MTTIQSEHFTAALTMLLDEAFDNVHGIFLDKGTSMFETLATISAEEASVRVGGRCATLAAQVRHVAFYLDVIERNARSGQFAPVDWGQIWRETGAVSADEWEAIKSELRASYERIRALIPDTEWNDSMVIGGAMATVIHTAYHLGEIRQALCVLKQ